MHIIIFSLLQKMAMRDQPAMLELLQIACLMNYLWPELEKYIGKGKPLDTIVDMWQMGLLGLQNTNPELVSCQPKQNHAFWRPNFQAPKNAVENKFHCIKPYVLG